MQSVMGIQFGIVEDVWHEYVVLDVEQAGGSREMTTEFPIMDLILYKAEHSYMHKDPLAATFDDQSKAYDTLQLYLGQEMPLRRLAVPEQLIHLNNALKTGGHTMAASAYGPNSWD